MYNIFILIVFPCYVSLLGAFSTNGLYFYYSLLVKRQIKKHINDDKQFCGPSRLIHHTSNSGQVIQQLYYRYASVQL